MAATASAQDAGVRAPDAVVHLYATDGVHATADGREIYVWGYSLEPVRGSATLPGPTVEVREGDLVEIHLTNLGAAQPGVHPFPHTVHLHGLDVDQANDGVPETGRVARVGETVTYRFVARHAGTYWYHCHVDTVEHLTMGMYGALIVHPTEGPGRAWTDGPRYDRAYTLLLSEVDPAWAEAIRSDRTPERTRFEPRYFFINGRSFPDTLDHPDTHLVGHLGERVLVRLINAGYGWRSMHMHGFHFEVVATDGRPLAHPYLKDTISVAPGERYDLLVTLDQVGAYPFHSHVVLDNLNDGDYPGGIHTMVTVAPPGVSLEDALHGAHGHGAAAREVGEPAAPADPADASSPAEEPRRPNPVTFGGFPIRRPVAPPAVAAASASVAVPEDGVVIELRGDRFRPEHRVVAVGSTVTWVNHDPRTHTLDAPAFGTVDLRRHESWSHTFTEPGTYPYTCVNHRGMSGVITVR
jgi:manganese oxidase